MSNTPASDSLPPRSVNPLLLNICQRFWPQLKTATQERQVLGVGEVISTLYAAPFAIAGIIWLIMATDWVWLRANLFLLALFAVLIFSFNQLRFFLIVELRENRYGSADGDLTGIPLWSGVLLFGPAIFWLSVLRIGFQLVSGFSSNRSSTARWGQWRITIMSLASETIVPLAAFTFYRSIGGQFPFAALSVGTILPALLMFGAYFLFYAAFWMPIWRIIPGRNKL